MARTVKVGEFQSMQRQNGPSHVGLGEMEASGDADGVNGQTVAERDLLTGQVVDAPTPTAQTVAEQLAELVIGGRRPTDVRPVGEVAKRLEARARLLGIQASDEEITAEARRRCGMLPTADAPVGPKPEDRAESGGCSHAAIGLHGLCAACGEYAGDGLGERLAGRAEKLAGELGRPRDFEVDVAPDGIVEGVRPAEMTPDRGEGVGTSVHRVTDDEPRFSGGGDGSNSYMSEHIPQDIAFKGKLYREAPELANIAERLIGEHGFLEDLVNCDIRWYWKRKTGVSKGRVKIGFMKRASDLLGHFSGADFIGWLSATTARDGRFTDQQVEAAVFHQLLHIGSDDKGNWIFVPHDFEGFAQEVRVYGTWTEGLKLGGQSFVAAHQMGLFADEDGEEDGEEGDEIDVSGEDVYDGNRYAGDGPDPDDELDTLISAPREPFIGDEPADPDLPYDDEEPDTSGELPTAEEIALKIGRCPHGHEGCNGRHDLADDPLADPAVI